MGGKDENDNILDDLWSFNFSKKIKNIIRSEANAIVLN